MEGRDGESERKKRQSGNRRFLVPPQIIHFVPFALALKIYFRVWSELEGLCALINCQLMFNDVQLCSINNCLAPHPHPTPNHVSFASIK